MASWKKIKRASDIQEIRAKHAKQDAEEQVADAMVSVTCTCNNPPRVTPAAAP